MRPALALTLALACAPHPADSPGVIDDPVLTGMLHEPASRAEAPTTQPPPDEPADPAPVAARPLEHAPKAMPARTPPPGLVDLRALLPELCFDIRYHTADNFTGAPLPGYGAPGAWLRERPAGALARARAGLAAHGLTFLVYDAYRPARASRAMVAWAERAGRRDLVDAGYIARRSGHNRGDTLDLTLARAGTCEPLDMGTAWDHLGPESHYARADGEALHNRRRLRDALRAAGFTPYAKEWWHFSYHDAGAVPLDIPYGEADPP